MANYQSQYTGPEIDAALGKAEDHEGRVQTLENGFAGRLASLAGLSGAADKLPYLSGADTFALADLSAAGRLLLGGADAAAQRTTLGLGDAATKSVQASSHDETAGRLMAVGAFGLGGSAIELTGADDLDNIDVTGYYWWSSATPPANVPVAAFSVMHNLTFGSRRIQLVHRIAPEAYPKARTTYTRSIDHTGTPTPWRVEYHQGNIVDTVSQSGGIPTGGIIERGSNANGEYVRFADGTQECWLTPFATLASAPATWTFPATFAAGGTVIAGASPITALNMLVVPSAAPSATAVNFRSFEANSGDESVSPPAMVWARGRWF